MNRGRYFVFVLFNILWVSLTRGEYPNMVTIKSFSPKIAAVGQTIHFRGTNLNKVAKVQLNGVTVPPVNIVRKLASSTEFDLMVPPQATSGVFRLITLDGKIVNSTAPLKIEPLCDPQINSNRTLAIRNLNVVNHPNTVFKAKDLANSHWSFGYLMGRIAGLEPGPLGANSLQFEANASKFILNWLNSFQCDPRATGNGCFPFIASPNGSFVFGRAAISGLIKNWPKKRFSWGEILDLEKAPFRLLSIMSRIDLRNPNQAGEGRFVFGVTDKDGNLTQFTVILEYRLPLSPSNLYPRNSLADWAKRWADLSSLNPNSPQYIEALEKVTNAFSDARFADLPNQSAINQVRSNEIALDFPWQLREWNLGKVSKSQASFQLLPATVKQTPSQEFNNTQALADWANKNQDAILDGSLALKDSDVISVKNQSRPLLGAFANIDQNWVLPGVKEPVRKAFAVNMTCNGCHSFETGTLFTHVSPREKTTVASFSFFLQEDIKSRQSDLKNVLIEEFCK